MCEEPSDTDKGVLTTLEDAIVDSISNIPAPIRKNFLVAFKRLCTAVVDYPVAILEGKAEEKRAETRSRIKLIETTANQIAEQLKISPEYARVASSKFGEKIVRERVNIDKISMIALEEIKCQKVITDKKEESSTPEENVVPPISEDWLNAFEDEAAKMSSDQMQSLFGKILAGEIQKPASYSIKTIKIMSQLDNVAASLFKALCSMSVSIRINQQIIDARVVSMGNAGSNSLLPYGLGFDHLNTLQEYGLIIADYNCWMDYQISVAVKNVVSIPLTYQNEMWGLVEKQSNTSKRDIKLTGVGFTKSGKELLSIVDVTPNDAYTQALKKHIDDMGFLMKKITN